MMLSGFFFQIEGPISPAELVEILQRTMEEQGLAFGSGFRAMEEERRRADRVLREEQDAAYLAALHIDKVSPFVFSGESFNENNICSRT